MTAITLLILSIIAIHFYQYQDGTINFSDNSKSENEMYVEGFTYPVLDDLVRICDNLYIMLASQNTISFDMIFARENQMENLFHISLEYRKTKNSYGYLTN